MNHATPDNVVNDVSDADISIRSRIEVGDIYALHENATSIYSGKSIVGDKAHVLFEKRFESLVVARL